MGESNGTNMKPILPILFFNKLMKIGLVIVPSPERWRERLLGTSTKTSQKVLINDQTISSFKQLLKEETWNQVYNSSCTNETFNKF
jgi:hypothetical protein